MSLLSTLPAADSAPAWLMPLRQKASEALKSKGLPNKKTEAWRFIKVSHLVDAPLEPAVAEQSAGFATMSPAWRVHFHAGRPIVGPNVPDGVEVSCGLEANVVELGSLARNEHFAALNTACFSDVLVLRVRGVVEQAVEVEYEGARGATYPRVLIVLEENASLRLIERASRESAMTVSVTEVIVGNNASLDHVRIHGDRGTFIGSLAVQQKRDSRYHSHVFSIGGSLMRLDLDVRLEGPNAECHLNGVYMAAGESESRETIDHHVRVDHIGPHCTSHQRYRGVLDGKGTAVFDGQAIVHRSAPASEAHQENRNLLLSDTANVHTKPHLEIDHDEVVASHGATVGALDPESLFYLRSRGVPDVVAQGILTLGFLRELLDRVSQEDLRAELGDVLLDRLPASEVLRSFE